MPKTKLLIVGGSDRSGPMNLTEVIDLSDFGATCAMIPPFPYEVYDAAAVTNDAGEAVLCGGYNGQESVYADQCYRYA